MPRKDSCESALLFDSVNLAKIVSELQSCQNFLLSLWARSCLCRKELSALNGDKEALADLVQRAAAPSHLATKREQNRGG